MKSNKLNSPSDEQLAAFIDGNLSESENESILDSIQTKEDLEALTIALSAKKIIEETDNELDDMPDINELSGKSVKLHPFDQLPMAGFLGNNNTDNNSDNSDDNEK